MNSADCNEFDMSNNGRAALFMPMSNTARIVPPPPPTQQAAATTVTSNNTVTAMASAPAAAYHSKIHATDAVVGGGGEHELNIALTNNCCMTPSARSSIGGSTITTAGSSDMGADKFATDRQQQQQQHERYVWEIRTRTPNSNVTPASTVLNSPDLNTDVQYALPHHNHHQHHQIRVGRSPGSQFDQHNLLPQGLTSPGSPTDVGKAGGQCLRDGEIVVFDDIDTNWMNKTNNIFSTSSTSMAMTASMSMTTTSAVANNYNNIPANLLQHNNEDILKVTKMIGQLPIAELNQSPRRLGNQPLSQTSKQQHQQQQQQQSAATNSFPKRPPGFPQRVSPMSMAQQQQQQEQSLRQHMQQQPQSVQQQQQYYATSALTVASMTNNISENNKSSTGNLIDIDDESACVDNGSGIVVEHSSNSSSGGVGVGPVFSNCDVNIKAKTPTFDYLYEFSETRKVLEEFFKANPDDEKHFNEFNESSDDVGSCDTHQDYEREREREEEKHIEQAYIGQRLARIPKDELYMVHRSPKKQTCDNAYNEHNDIELYIDSNSRSSGDLADTELEANLRRHSRNFTLSPETTDYDSNCGDLDSLSNDINCTTDYGKLYTSMPVLEDGLSSGHASDTENNTSVVCDKQQQQQQQQIKGQQQQQMLEQNDYNSSLAQTQSECHENCENNANNLNNMTEGNLINNFIEVNNDDIKFHQHQLQQQQQHSPQQQQHDLIITDNGVCCNSTSFNNSNELSNDSHYEAVYAATINSKQATLAASPPPPAPAAVVQRQQVRNKPQRESADIQEAMREIRSALQRAKTQPEKLKFCDEVLPPGPDSPIWVPRKNSTVNSSSSHTNSRQHLCNAGVGGIAGGGGEDEELDTDLETDRLLGQQRLDEQNFYDEKTIWPKTSRIGGDSNEHSPSASDITMLTNNSASIKPQAFSSATIRHGVGTSITPNSPEHCQIVGSADVTISSPEKLQFAKSPTGSLKSLKDSENSDKKAKTRNKEALLDPAVLIEGVLFRARYLGSTQLVCEGQPTKSTRMMQAEEAVSRIKAPEGESQPSTEVDLFISTEKIMVLNTDLKEIMMDHALRTISYIADIGDLVVLMARRRFVPSDSCSSDAEGNNGTATNDNAKDSDNSKDTNTNNTVVVQNGSNKHSNRTPKMICHVFESDEAQFIAQSIGQAFQVAYMEFLKANGIEDHSFVKEMDYQEVLNSQEIFGDELEIFAKKELQKEVVVPKAKGEILGVVIVESGWGSMLPTVVIANLMSAGAAARCGQLNIGDQLIAINGMSLVGLPLSTCQSYIRNAKNQTAVKFTVVPCPPVVEVKIKRPNTKYQLGFSVQNGVICSLLRGGIAERGGVRVGHRIIEINNQSVVAVPHEKIVNLLATSVGEILMKTMPTSMFRLLTGQENPIYI